MTTLTETIYEKLMGAVDDPVALEKVFHESAGSKGPFYIALAKATTSLQERFNEITQKCNNTAKVCLDKQQQIKAADQNLTVINQSIDVKSKEILSLDGKIADNKSLLDGAKMIAELGFGTTHLSQLNQLLSKMASSQGVKPTEATALFFKQVGHYQDLFSLELEVKGAQVASSKAKADFQRWQAEAATAEAKCKARKTSIDLADKLIAQGVKETDLPHWESIISQAGLKVEKLANDLQQFGSLEKLIQHRQKEEQKLNIKISELSAQVKTLTNERLQVSTSIDIVKKEALTQIQCMSKQTLDNMDNLAAKSQENILSQQQNASKAIEAIGQKNQAEVEVISKKILEDMQSLMNGASQYAILEREAGELSQELIVARALKSQNPEHWKKLSFHSIREMLNGIMLWSHAGVDNNPGLSSPPAPLASKISFYSHKSASLDEVVAWAVTGVYSDAEREAANNGYMIFKKF